MPKINILESNIYNRISAGEVVERPASIVKELVENSLDAGATAITVEVKKGGIEEIKVADNGCGIEYADMENAFLPHATSKITALEDLDDIHSLGFRGEALASIAAVAMVDMKSKTETAETGGEIEIHGGVVERFLEAGCANGTQTIVRNIFYNTPARAKFLKKPKSEEAEITNLMARFVLVNDKISFKYVADGKTVYQSNGTGLKDAITIVYGSEAASSLIPVQSEHGGMKLTGYVGKTSYTKPNKTYQTVSLNGRYIVNATIAAAIHNVYAEYLMKRNYPFYVLALSIPYESVDVNVHPNKLDVRFENTGSIYSLFYNAVGNAVSHYNREQIALFNRQNGADTAADSAAPTSFSSLADRSETTLGGETAGEALRERTEESWAPDPAPSDIMSPFYQRKDPLFGYLRDSGTPVAARTSEEPKPVPSEAPPAPRQDALFSSEQEAVENVQSDMALPENYRVLGQIFQSYILIESGEELLIIDQHAAHERLLFDRLKKDIDSRSVSSQSLLIPYVFTLNPLEIGYFKEQVGYLSEMGFSIEEFGSNAFRIGAVPHYLSGLSLKDFIDEILQDMNGAKRGKTSDSIRDMLAQKACKAAVKAGMVLSASEIERLLADMREGSVLQCPHGRPVVYTVTKKDIEKWFKRIV